MAITTCPKCPSTYFELKEAKVSGSRYRTFFVQCSSCGAAIGIKDYFNEAELLVKICKKLGIPT